MSFSEFIFPKLTKAFFARIAILVVITWLVGTYWLRPLFVDGESMMPTYSGRGLNVCLLTAYRSHPPARGDVVVLKYGGSRYMLMKRVLAFAGETVSFKDGICVVDGKPLDEPYVVLNSGWNVPPRTVKPGHIYVMGDNRSVPFENHVGGEISLARVVGKPLFEN